MSAPRAAILLASLLVLPVLAGCLGAEETPPAQNIGGGNDGGSNGGGSNLPPLFEGKHINVTLLNAPLSEGRPATLRFVNDGNETLAGALTVEIVHPDGYAIARVSSSSTIQLLPRGAANFTVTLPSKLEGGVYRLKGTLNGATAEITTPIGGSAKPGEGPFPLGFTPVFRLEVNPDKEVYFRGEPILVTLVNKGNVPVRGFINVSVHGPGTAPNGAGQHTAPKVAGRDYADLTIPVDGNLTLAPFSVPLSAVPTSFAQYYVHVEWTRGTSLTGFAIDNRTARPAPDTSPVARTWQTVGAPQGWTGKTEFTIDSATSRKATLWFAKNGEPGPASTDAYRNSIITAMQASWAWFKNAGYQVPDPTMPIHIYIDHPGGNSLGTMQPKEYGAHVIIGPESLHTDKGADARTTASHELFHVFQTSYDFDEGLLLEGLATWIMDLPITGAKDYLGQSRSYLNEPDGKPLQYREHELVLFVHWLASKYGGSAASGYPEMRKLTEMSRDYDNKDLVERVFGKRFDDLWVEFVTDVAKRAVGAPHTQELFEKQGVFGLKAWQWVYTGSATNLTNEKTARTLTLPFTGFADRKAEMIDEDVGRIRHAYGFDVYNVTADLGLPPANDNVRITFTSRDAPSNFTVLLAVQPYGGAWTVTKMTPGTGAVVQDLRGKNAYVFVTRTDVGKGTFDIALAPA